MVFRSFRDVFRAFRDTFSTQLNILRQPSVVPRPVELSFGSSGPSLGVFAAVLGSVLSAGPAVLPAGPAVPSACAPWACWAYLGLLGLPWVLLGFTIVYGSTKELGL